MSCFTPIAAYRGQGGAIVFNSKEGFGDKALNLPCGKCVGCRVDKARAWSLRAAHEAQLHDHNSFVTLTYRPESLPDGGTLVKAHWQLFAKRLRKALGPFRFLMCGEYGDESYRPHYHALIFGHDFHEDRTPWKVSGDNMLYTSQRLEGLWSHGFVSIGDVSRQSAEYVARYTLKKVRGDEYVYRRISEHGEEYFVEPEFALMSRRPGLGAEWYKRFRRDLYPSDECILDGRKYPVPRYYDDKLKNEDPDAFASLRAARRRRAVERDEVVDAFNLPRIGEGDRSPRRLDDRRQVAERHIDGASRPL